MIGRTDVPLHELGIEQARCTAAVLRDKNLNAIFSSPLLRAVQTAEVIAAECPGLTVIQKTGLEELHLGLVDGLSSFMAYEQFRAEMDRALDTSIDDFSFPAGESRLDALQRFSKAMDEIVHNYATESVCIVTHGGPLGLWLAHMQGLPLGMFRMHQPSHASITEVEYSNRAYTIKRFNVVKHATHLERQIEELQSGLP